MGRFAVSAALDGLGEQPGSHLVAVDATCGNGHDTLFLSKCLASRARGDAYSILSFDIQQAALDAARVLTGALPATQRERIFFLLRSHDELQDALQRHAEEILPPETAPKFAAAMYNLGFLPRSDRRIITRARSTLASLAQAAGTLAPGGLLCIHAYSGHPGGQTELEAVGAWCSRLPFDEWAVVRYSVCNKTRNPEVLFLAWRRTAV